MKKIIIIIILMLTTFMGENIYSNNKEKNKNEYIENIVEIVDKTPENMIITPEENKTQKINENSVLEEQTGVEKNKTIVSTPKEEKIVEQPKVQEVQKIQKVEEPIQISQPKEEIKVVETKPESIKEPEPVIPKCSESNHYIGVGNSNKWFNSKQEAINYYQSIIKTWGDKWEKFEIDDETLNSMIPIWKKNKSEVTDEDYNNFYQEKFGDFQKPLKVIRTSVEGDVSYTALLYIPSHLPYDYYTKDFKRGLQLYSNGVLIMDKCEDLLPDTYGFVRGLVDSPDLSLNISREMLQHDRQLKIIAKNLDKKIKSELLDMLHKDRENYDKFFETFGTTLKFGVYNDYGLNKDNYKDLLMFHSSTENKLVTLDEYVDRMKEGQDKIYYACGETIDKIEMLPQVEAVKEKGYEILYLTENVDEFVMQVLLEHKEKKFVNVCANDVDLDTAEEKEALKKENEENKDMFALMKEAIGEGIQEVRFTHRLKNHPVCLTSEGALSVEMEKVINSMPNDQKVKAQTALEINDSHPIAQKIKDLYANDKEELKKYTKVLYSQARLIEGLPVENPTEISNLICEIIAK